MKGKQSRTHTPKMIGSAVTEATLVFKLSLESVNIFAIHSLEIVYITLQENCWCGILDYSDFLQSEITDWNGLGGVRELHWLKIQLKISM